MSPDVETKELVTARDKGALLDTSREKGAQFIKKQDSYIEAIRYLSLTLHK